MSDTIDTPDTEHQESTAHSHGQEHGYGAEHGSLKSYLIGFSGSVVLTVIPFWLVLGDVLSSNTWTVVLILALGVMQIFVHLRYFLHIDTATEGGWQLMSLIFCLVLLMIALVGTVWVMGHLDANMKMNI